MKKFYLTLIAALTIFSSSTLQAQCNGVKGPNLLGAKGSFSTPFISINNTGAACLRSGTNTYNPIGNVGSAIAGCSTPGQFIPCTDYVYTAASGGLNPEGRYAILKVIGNSTGGNCIKPEWRGSDHTGDGGYFMAVNGAANNSTPPVFYKIKSIPVCIGATYEFSAWVLNILPAGHPAATPGTEPNISFKVNGVAVGSSGPIAYNNSAAWVKVGGSFVATTSIVDLEVINTTVVASGNDLGLDDISFNVCQSQVSISAPSTVCEGSQSSANYNVTDVTQTNTWYKYQLSTDGGTSFTDISTPAQASFIGNSYTVNLNLGTVTSAMNGYKYRLVVSTSASGLSNPDCIFFNDYTLVVTACGPTPVSLIGFNGKYNSGLSSLDWQTSQEWNSDRFEILRSINGIDFKVVGNVKSAGNSTTLKNYQFQDVISGSGYVYYRLRQVDFDSKVSLSPIIRLNMGSKTASFELYPNPFVNGFTASFSASRAANANLQIRNISGQIIYNKTISVTKGFNSIQLNSLPVLSRGLYHVSIQNEDLNYQGKLQKL